MDGQLDGQGSRSPGYGHVDSFTAKAHGHVPEGAIVIADPNLIFNGEFKRTGVDLVLSHDGHEFVVHDYFRGDKRAAIASPDGAHLTGDIVSALTGYVQVAQAAPGAAAAQVIGHVTKLTGSATAIRNGVSVILNNGDNVEKGDVVSTGSDSTLGVTFIDGTVFGLSSNARMVLNEMVYDPNGSNNSSLLSLVAGTITFVAGETAKHGDMKIDTPVATMGIRGTAVLTEINFVVPSGGGDPQPQANFQVLVEPNGTTGSYILFDKLTLLPIATVNQAGQMIQISGGNVSVTNGLLSPEVQKLITDVFTLKFTDNNTNTKLTTNFTDTITQNGNIVLIKTDTGATATATFTNTVNTGNGPGQGGADKGVDRIPGPPTARSLDLNGNVTSIFKLTEHVNATGDRADTTSDAVPPDTISGRITFVDQNLGDRPTVSVNLAQAPNFVYQNAGQQDVTGSLTALQRQDIAATQIQISVVPDGGNNNNGSAVWTYTIPDHVFDFLAAGETLTLTYIVSIDDNFGVNPETTTIPITITITGTNDKPVITTSVPTITFSGGTSVPGGPLTTKVPTSGTLTFTDVDLTDTHTVSVSKLSAVLPGGTVPQSIYNFFANDLSVSIASGHDSTGSGTGTINWSLGDIPVYLADFIPKGQVLTLTYTVTVKDSQGATSDQTITVTITGTDAPAVVWIATNAPGAPSGGFWKDGANWETGNAPAIGDDVIVITDQLHGLTPSYPVTIDAAAYANSLTMNDFDTNAGHKAPEVINKSSLTIATTLTLGADSKLTNLAAGSISVGGKAEFSGTSVLANAGYLTLAHGGDFSSGTSITNSGTIELSGGTLTTLTEIHNAGGTLKVDGGTTTLIVNAATVDGGTVTIYGALELDGTSLIENGTLNNFGAVNVKGAAEFANETVDNKASGALEVWADHALTIDQGSRVNNAGNVKVDASGKLTVNGATIDGGAIAVLPGTPVVDGSPGEAGGSTIIFVTPSIGTVTNNGELDLTGNGVLSNGILKNNGTLNVSGTGNALNGETVTNAGTIEVLAGALAIGPGSVVDNSSGNVIVDAALTLNGATISGGTINNYSSTSGGTIAVTGDSTIDGNAALNKGGVKVASDVTLTFGDATVSSSGINNGGTVKVETDKKLTLVGASLTGGALTVAGTLASSGTTTITDANISNTYLIDAIGGLLTLAATTSAPVITNDGGTIRANNAELDINGEAVTNTGTLAAINDGTLKLISNKVTNTGGTVSVELGSTLDLSSAIVKGGTLTIAGALQSTGTSAITDADITNTGTISITSGTLTIDPIVLHTITNSHLIQANGGELDFSGEHIVNTADIKAIGGGILKLTSLAVANDGGTFTVDGTSKLYLTGVSINGGSLSNSGILYGVSGPNAISAGVTNTGTIEVQAGTLNLSGGLTGAGSLVIDDGATLELAGATAQIVTFAGGTDTLQLDKVAGQSFTGTIAGQSSNGGTFTITGAADITTSSGDALDFTASGGTLGKPAGIVLTPTGALKGTANGVVVTQNGTGAISLTATNDITGLAGNGITLRDSATGAGGITVNDLTGKATGTGADSVGVLVENLNAANAGGISITQLGGAVGGAYGIDATTQGDGDITIDAGGSITGSSIYGIRARSYGAGSETVTTEAGSVVTSGSSGIVAVNRAMSLDASSTSTITVNAHGSISSGSSLNQGGNPPAGIQAGYAGATTGASANTGVNGTVVVNNYANITAAAGSGIDAYNYGNGDVTVNSFAGTTISVAGTQSYGIEASAQSGGTGNITVTLGANVTISGATAYGIKAYSIDAGNISVTVAKGDSITSGSSGIVAVNYATGIGSGLNSTITVEANGTIHSGATLNNDGTTPGAIIAGYKPGGTAAFSSAVNGDVIVGSDATITADAGYGIDSFTWGAGKVTVTTGTTSQITAAGTAIGAFDHGGGDVSVTNEGSATGAVGLSALATGAGNVTIVNDGHLTGTSSTGITVTQDAAGATGSTHITNTGSVVGTDTGSVIGAAGHAAISIQENTYGTALIDNSGTIGPDSASVTSTTYAIFETGGAITINNTGHINGNISVASATFDNEASGTWTVSGTSVFGNLSSIDNDGAIDLLDGASISGSGLSIDNSGEIYSWGTTSITGTITNTGAIEVHTGTLSLFGSLWGAGSVTIDAGATLDVDGAVSQTITFSGGGAELQIDTTSFGGSVAGFAATDKLDLSTIKFDGGTSATYDPETGDLVVSDAYGHSITVKLTGGDYSNAHFAGSSDGHGGTLITYNATDDKPTFTVAETSQSAVVTEQPNLTGATTTMDQSTPTGGTIHFTDIDLTDRPTATITDHAVTGLAADGTTPLTLTPDEVTALENALSLQLTGKNNGAVSWIYSIADSTLDFLGEGQTAKVVSTTTLDDGHKTDTAQVTITITGANDAPVITTGTNDTASATLPETNAGLTKSGTLTVSDADATDHVTVALDHVTVYLDGVLQADGIDGLTNADLLNYLTVQSGDILNGTATHAQFSWDFNSGNQAFDFLAAGHTLSLQYAIVPNDGHTATGTGNGIVTINIAGTNDSPTLDNATLASVAGNDSNPAGDTVSHLFAGKFHDADDGASLKAVAVTSDSAATTEGVWQYEVAGTHQWVDIGSVGDTHALVMGPDALIRFVPANGYTGTPDPLGVHALDNTYTGAITTSASPATIDITSMSTDGTAPVSSKAATISTDVTAPASGPVIDTDNFVVSHNHDLNTDTITNLSVVDTDSNASTDSFTVTAEAANSPAGSVDLSPMTGLLADINTAFQNGVTYTPGSPPPDTDRITLTVTDTTTGLSDTVNFIFNEHGNTENGITLTGTSGKDVIFATTTGDTLSGGGGKDQFVFAPGSAGYDDEGHPVADYAHTITDFIEGMDRIDLRQFSGVSSISNLSITQQSGDTLVAWQQQLGTGVSSVTEHESLLLKNVITANLKASDFIFHIT
ncbi:VCBS domain-containing protein [Bradyrhizobium ganzhouense]|uniref:VCBS domain-containing protein n=1 Tax=Bradyrhizobium ganzhouense TaxID=1179767 RepID=UPI003CFB04FE